VPLTKHRYEPIPGRKCKECGGRIGAQKRANTLYCSHQCKDKVHSRNRSKKKHDEKVAAQVGADPDVELLRMGPVFREGKEQGYFHDIHAGFKSQTDVSVVLGVTVAAVSRAYQAWLSEEAGERIAADWVMDDRYRAMLPVDKIAELRLVGSGHNSTEMLVDECLEQFWLFEHEFITIGSMQDSFIVELFHRESIEAIFRAFLWGGRTLILTPPRHGKSEMMLRFASWIIIMFPNIQVLWVAANADLAENMCTKLKGIFQYTESLRVAFLPPKKKFGDDGAPRWRGHSFTLYTRTDHTLTSPTFTALGSSATIAGRNADWIGIDDLEERKTVATAELREKSRRKHSEIMERQEDHTGVATIGSRQHPDDIPNHLLAQDGEEGWDVHVFPAHDDMGCTEDPEEYEAHVECMLLPQIRPYRWLMAREQETLALGLPGRFPLRYQQKAVPVEGIIFDIPLIKDRCLDRSRGTGMDELPAMRLLAGLDPAARGVQAAFAWGWDGKTLHMIDLETADAGGVIGAARIMAKWDDAWELKEWFHEDNSGQIDAWKHVAAYTDTIRERSLIIRPHTTGKNKHDPESGISSMATWYHAGRISLPYGTSEARRKTNMLLRQLELWTSDGLAKRGKTDIKMAHWFPFPRIQKWDRTDSKTKLVLMSDQSYPTLDRNQPEWGSTPYPGG
jgi:hypothetical protein